MASSDAGQPDEAIRWYDAYAARYGHTGRLSYYMDGSGIQKKDTGGKPLSPAKSK